ncbi:MAG: diguanylate cyclase [Cyanobacteria bacterium SZAS-4]|nr:diguanylate cyclase [Cyanobacteria bacterium SZAS-4]
MAKKPAEGGDHHQGKPKEKAHESKTSNDIYGHAPAKGKHPASSNAGHEGASTHGHSAVAPKESGLSKLIHQGEHLLASGEKMLTRAIGSHDDKQEKTAASKRPEIPNKVAHADKLSSAERSHQHVSDYTDPVTKKHFHYNDRGLVDKVHGVNGAVTTIAYKREGNVDKPIAFTTTKENHPNLLQSACASDKVVLKVDQRTGDVTTSCHEKVTVLDQNRKPVSQELKVERQFSSEGACSEVRSDLKGHRIDKSIVGPDNKPVAVIHYNYRHDAGKTDAHQSVMAVQMDAQGRPVHQFVFATADDIEKQKPSMREDRKYSEKEGVVRETHRVFDLHTGKDVPIFQSEQTIDLNKGRTTIHEETFKDGQKTPVQDKTITFNESGKPIELKYKNEETKTDVTVTFTRVGKAVDLKGKLGDEDKQHLLHQGDVEVANALTHYQVKAIDTADLLAHGGPTAPRHGEKPTGTVAWKEGETYKQGSVVDGNVLDADKKVIGTINDAGDVQIGTTKFNILSDQSHAAVFHGIGTDHERLDLCQGQAMKAGERREGYNGYLTDGKEKMTAIGGNIFDKHGKFFAHMDEKGQLVFADDADQKEKSINLSAIKPGGGWQFIGNENGKARQFDVDGSSNGNVFLARLDAHGSPLLDATGHPVEPIKCIVQMGMLIDSTSGKQIGKFVPPAINDDKSWGEGRVLLFGQNPGDKPTVTDLSNMKNTIFDITTTGQGTSQTMRGAVVGPKEVQADGSTRPGVGGIVNFDQAVAVSEQNLQNKKAALDERLDTENKQALAIGVATHDVTGINARLYNKAIAGEEQTEAAQVSVDLATKQVTSEKEKIDQLLKTGKLDENTIYSLQRMTTLNKSGGLDNLALLKQRVENPQHVLENLSGSAQIYSGSIKRPDPDHPGKIIDYDIKSGYVYKKNSDHIIGSVNPTDGSLRLLNDAGRAEVSRMSDPTLKGAVIHLECPSGSGKTTSVDWVNDGRGQLISIGQLRKQAAEERAYAELMAKGDASGTTNKEALERTKVLEARYTKTLNSIVENGITDVNSVDKFSSLEQLKGGPQAFVKAEQNRPEPHAVEKKISVPKFETEADCQRASGPMRLGHDHFVVDKGVIYRARLEGNEWKREETPCGNLQANYVAKIDGHDVVLRDQSQFLFQLRLQGESQDHRIIGLGPSRVDGNGAITAGGLVDANELLRQGALAQNSTAISANEYRDSEGYITLGIPDAAMGGRAAQLDLVHDTAENQQRGLHKQIDQLFIEGLSGNTLATADVNHNVRSIRNFVQDMHLSTDDASNLSAEGREMQKQSSEAVAMAALSVVPGGGGLLASRLGFGLVGRVGITMAGGGLVSTIARQTHGGGWQQAGDNFASGSVEALTMWAGSEGTQLISNLKVLQAAKLAGPEAMAALSEPLKTLAANPMTGKVLEVMAKPGGAVAVEGFLRTVNAGIQTMGFSASGAIRSGNYDEFTAGKMAEGTLYMMAGEGLAALAHHPITKMGPNVPMPFGKGFEKGMETFAGSAINNFTNSALNARAQAELAEKEHIAQELGLKPEQVSLEMFEKYKNVGRMNAFILHSAAEGAAMTVVTHPVSHMFNHFAGERVNAEVEQAAAQDRVALRRAVKDDFVVRNPADVLLKGDSKALDILLFRQLKIDDHECFQDNMMRHFVREVRDGTKGWTPLDSEHPETAKIVEERRTELEQLLGKVFNNKKIIAPKIEIVPDDQMGVDDAAYVPGQAVVQMKESRFFGLEPLKIEEVAHEALGHLWQDHLIINKAMLDALRLQGLTDISSLVQDGALTKAGHAFCENIAAQELTRSEELVKKSLLANPDWVADRLTKEEAELQTDAQYMRASRLTESFAQRRDAGDDQLHSLINLLMGRKLDSRIDPKNIEVAAKALLEESVNTPLPAGFNAEKALEAMTKSLNRHKLFGYDPLEEKYLITDKNMAGHEMEPRIDRVFEDHLKDPQFFERNPNFFKDMVEWSTEPNLTKKNQLQEKWLETLRKEYPYDDFGEIGAPTSPKVLARFTLKAELFLMKHFKTGGGEIGGLEPHEFEHKLPKLVRELIKDHLYVATMRGYHTYRANFFELEAHFIHLRTKQLIEANDVEHKPEEENRQRTARQMEYAKIFVPDEGGRPGWKERIIEIENRAKAEADARKAEKLGIEPADDFSNVLQNLHQARESGAAIEDDPSLNFKENSGIPDDYMYRSNSEQVKTNSETPSKKIRLDMFSDTPTKLTPEPVAEVDDKRLPPPAPMPYEHHQKLEAARIQNTVNPIKLSMKANPFESAGLANEDIYRERTPDPKLIADLKLGAPVVELRRELLREIQSDPAREQIDKNAPNQLELIQERKNRENEEAYARLAKIDPLTGAGTQKAVEEELMTRCAEAARTKKTFTVAYVDLDEFGTANRTVGRPCGDLALGMYVEAVDRLLVDYPGVSLARLGGDEFVFIGDFDEKFLQAVRKIRLAYGIRDGEPYVRLMREDEIVSGADPVRASIGAVAWREGETPEQILKRSDKEMQANKELRKFGHPLREFKPEVDATKSPSADAITSKFERTLSTTSEEFRAKNPDLFAKIDERLHEASADRLMLAKRLYTHHLTELPKDFICQRVLGREVVRMNQAQRTPGDEQKLFLIKADINNFKSVNDENDHSQGDALLKIYGANLRDIVGSGKDNFVGSPGGGAAFIIAHSEAERDAIVRRLEHWQGPADMQPKDKYKLCLSVGVAEWKPGMSATKLDESAEAVLAEVKANQEKAGIRKSKDQYAIDAQRREQDRRANRNIADRGKSE